VHCSLHKTAALLCPSEMFVIKARFGSDLRRFSVPETINFTTLVDLLSSLFPHNGFFLQTYSIKYYDDEGDLICLDSDEELKEALRLASFTTPLRSVSLTSTPQKVLRLELFLRTLPPISSTSSQAKLTPVSQTPTETATRPASDNLSFSSILACQLPTLPTTFPILTSNRNAITMTEETSNDISIVDSSAGPDDKLSDDTPRATPPPTSTSPPQTTLAAVPEATLTDTPIVAVTPTSNNTDDSNLNVTLSSSLTDCPQHSLRSRKIKSKQWQECDELSERTKWECVNLSHATAYHCAQVSYDTLKHCLEDSTRLLQQILKQHEDSRKDIHIDSRELVDLVTLAEQTVAHCRALSDQTARQCSALTGETLKKCEETTARVLNLCKNDSMLIGHQTQDISHSTAQLLLVPSNLGLPPSLSTPTPTHTLSPLPTSQSIEQTTSACHQLSEEVKHRCADASVQTSQTIAHTSEQLVKSILNL